MSNPWAEAAIVVDLFRAGHQGPAGIRRRRDERLAALLHHAATESPFYRQHLRGLRLEPGALPDCPPVTKPELMAHFEEWVTDAGVTVAGLERFLARDDTVGQRFMDRYSVWCTSGTTGQPARFVVDPGAVAVYRGLTLRLDATWLGAGDWWGAARGRLHWASIVGTGGHYAGESWVASERRRSRWRRACYQAFSVQQPLSALVGALNDFRPILLSGYPSALEQLAAEQVAGRLKIRPVLVESAGESVSPGARELVRQAWGRGLHEAYAASEFLNIALDCPEGWLHVNSDWVILEPVDSDFRPTPPGAASSTVLLTNLANRVQPLIRYDLGDSVTARPAPCPCGSPFPAIRVVGRRDDVLELPGAAGTTIRVLPLAIGSVVEQVRGIGRSQIVQTGPKVLELRLQPVGGGEVEHSVWLEAINSLRGYLDAMGAVGVTVERSECFPQQQAHGGKFRQVMGLGRAPGTDL